MNPLKDEKGLSTLSTILIIGAAMIIFAGSWIITLRIEGDKKVDIDTVLTIDDNIIITHTSKSHVRGEITNPETEEVVPVFYALISGEWQKILLEDGIISCEKMDKFRFPSSFISDCILQYPKAKTVAEVVDDIYTGDADGEIDIIGQIYFGDDPSCSSCFKISSGGADIDFDLGIVNNTPDLNPGDTVVVDVTVIDGETTVNKIKKIDNTNDTEEWVDVVDDNNLKEEIYYDITDLPPGFEIGEEYYKWLYDIDNSHVDVQIIQDF